MPYGRGAASSRSWEEELQQGDADLWNDLFSNDGSDYETAWPELARCGWSSVQVDCDGLPLRAVFGALPGARQTVGRAERHALHQAMLHMPYLRFAVTDLAA